MTEQKGSINVILTILLAAGMLLSSCSSQKIVSPAGDEIISLGEDCAEIYQAQIDAWVSKDPEQLRSVYTDDIVHFDGKPLFVGIDEVIAMAQQMFRVFPNWQMKAGQTYISREDCLGTWMFWDTGGLQEDDPGMEFDLLETRDGKISFWRLFYDHHFDSERINEEILKLFALTWSQGDPELILEIFSQDAVVEDTLFGVTATGPVEILSYRDSLLKAHPDTSWDLFYPFAEDDFANDENEILASKGGVFNISTVDTRGNSCQIQAVLILTPDPEGRIQGLKTFYEADSFVACGWAK